MINQVLLALSPMFLSASFRSKSIVNNTRSAVTPTYTY